MTLSLQLVQLFLLSFCILSLASVGGMFSERVGIVNIGINGMMIIGATVYVIFGSYFGQKPPIVAQFILILVSALGGGLFSLIHAFATIKLKADHTISGFAINMLAFGIALVLLTIYGGGSAKNVPFFVKEVALDSEVSSWKNLLSLRNILTVIILVLAFVALKWTRWGLRLKSIGENPQAADVAGVNVNSYKWQGVFISGLLAGIAGGFFVQYSPTSFKGEVQGLGYLALAIMIMGQWIVQWIVLSAVVFSLLRSASFVLPVFQPDTLGKFTDLFYTIPYFITFIMMILMKGRGFAPAAAGFAYDKSKR
ncbi:ABC transporter permease [[Mycoplasma] gypis]|uniref:ABC transporter permease n=1 Tax=[Mycoplasma] gypis TaxID=92404 RepID=A0ABZ2RNG9_9BACT|nr:ABC transporter permease [[Mycoplasma] gypis]MBN0919403.1 ABC transporter permease [[Mycoplasma] gypis]